MATMKTVAIELAEWREAVWAIRPERLITLLNQAARLTEKSQSKSAAPTTIGGGTVAVLPLYGPLDQRGGLLLDWFGGTGLDAWGAAFDSVVTNDDVAAVVLDVDSPGGSVYGVQETAEKVYQTRKVKPVIAVADSMMASAAYWIGSSASEVVVTPGGEVGSVGVLALHSDLSKAFEEAGIDNTWIFAGEYKVEGNPLEPLGDEARDFIQKRVDEYYGMFTDAVARNRGKRSKAAKSAWGGGRVFGAEEAVSMGLADRVGTLESVVAELTPKRRGTGTRRKRLELLTAGMRGS